MPTVGGAPGPFFAISSRLQRMRSKVQLIFDLLPQRGIRCSLCEHFAVRIAYPLHHSLSCKHTRE